MNVRTVKIDPNSEVDLFRPQDRVELIGVAEKNSRFHIFAQRNDQVEMILRNLSLEEASSLADEIHEAVAAVVDCESYGELGVA